MKDSPMIPDCAALHPGYNLALAEPGATVPAVA